MATIYIDNKPYEVNGGKNLLENCLSLGFDLPYFCWHPALGSVGACRQCAVKQYRDENDTEGKIVMSCMVNSDDQSRISVKDQEAVEFRKDIIEGLMTNHPHDCPTCDEGGECHLQDMTVMTGHNYRRYRQTKRTFRNQDLGPFLNHEMNRCITCYRCVRFYNDFAGGDDLQAYASANRVYFGREENGPLQNEFSGNLAEVCPTGVFTDKTLKKHYTRKWDLTTAPSICHHCSLGCNIIPGERYGSLRRVQSRYNGDVNGYFICDRGRYGYEYVNDQDQRITQSQLNKGGDLTAESTDLVLDRVGKLINESQNVIGIGSSRASLESNYMLWKLVGEENFHDGLAKQDHDLVHKAWEILKNGPAKTPSLRETQEADAVVILGEDVINTAPMLGLHLRQASVQKPKQEAAERGGIPDWHEAALQNAIQDETGPFYVATPYATKLDNLASATYRRAPEAIAKIGYALANQLNGEAPAVSDLNQDEQNLVDEMAAALKDAKKPLIVSGTSLANQEVMQAAANVAWALQPNNSETRLSLTVPEVNSMGIAMMGGYSLDDAFEKVSNEQVDTVVIMENDLYYRAESEKVDQFLENAKNVIVLDHSFNKTTQKADCVFASGTFAEADGTLVNNEGRAQRFYQVYYPGEAIHESWRWLMQIGHQLNYAYTEHFQKLDDFTKGLMEEFTVFQGAHDIAPPPGFRVNGQKIPRQPHRYSGRTAMNAHQRVSEAKPPEDPDTYFSFTMEGFHGAPPTSDVPFFWSPGWNSIQSVNKYQIEVGGELHGGDPGKRLIEPVQEPNGFYQPGLNGSGQSSDYQIVPIYHIFGSEELSSGSYAIQARTPDPYLAISKTEMENKGWDEGQLITVTIDDQELNLPVYIKEDLPGGCMGIPVGLEGIPYVTYPAFANIKQSQ